MTVGVTGSLGLHYMAAWTGGGEEAQEMSYKAGLAGWATPGGPAAPGSLTAPRVESTPGPHR